MKNVIINADDFGYSSVFNTAILDLIRNNLISSVSVLVNGIGDNQLDQVQELVTLSRSQNVSIGLHFDFSNDQFQEQIDGQYRKFIKMFGFDPTHCDLHKSIYLQDSYPSIMQFCQKKGIPCRNHGFDFSGLISTTNEVCDGTRMGLSELKKLIESFRDGESTEILFHPGKFDPNSKSSLNKEREEDVKKIIEISSFLKTHNVSLISYLEFISKKD